MIKFFTFFSNLQLSVNMGSVKELFFKVLKRRSFHLLLNEYIENYTEKLIDKYKLYWYSISF